MTYEYVARLAPINKTLDVVDPHSGERMAEQFTEWTFQGDREHPERIRLDLDHCNRDAGRVTGLHVACGWWVARFRVNHTLMGALAEDKLHIGANVSIGFDPILQVPMGHSDVRQYQMAKLNEVSIVKSSAYEGAKVISMIAMIPTRRRATSTVATSHAEPWLRDAQKEAATRGSLVRPGSGYVIGVR